MRASHRGREVASERLDARRPLAEPLAGAPHRLQPFREAAVRAAQHGIATLPEWKAPIDSLLVPDRPEHDRRRSRAFKTPPPRRLPVWSVESTFYNKRLMGA